MVPVTAELTDRWLPLDAGLNVRDVGGLPCSDGRTTRRRVLVRSGSLRGLTPSDVERLTAAGVRTVLDLRTVRELQADGPSPLARAGVPTVHAPLISDDRPALPEARTDSDAETALRQAYQGYVDQRGYSLVAAVRVVARADSGAVLVHCAAGKDRTGVTVGVALDAVGVERDAVLDDYTATNEVVRHVMTTLAVAAGYADEVEGMDMTRHYARAAALRSVLDRFDAEHGGAAGWLLAHGLRPDEFDGLRARLVDD